MGKLVYLALCFLFAFIVIGQLSAVAADVRKQQSQGEEIEACGRNNEEATGLTTQKKLVWTIVKFRKFLQGPDEGPVTCDHDPVYCNEDYHSCGGSVFCVCSQAVKPRRCLDCRHPPPEPQPEPEPE